MCLALPLLAASASKPLLPARLGRVQTRQAELQLRGNGVQSTNVTRSISDYFSDMGAVPSCPLPQGSVSRRHGSTGPVSALQRNLAFQKGRRSTPFKVCPMGDSVTEGFQGHNEIYVCRGGYRPALEKQLEMRGAELSGYRSCPCPAFSTAQSWQLHRELKSTNFQCGSQNGGASHPDLALMMIGTNDIYHGQPKLTILKNTRTMLEDLWAVSPNTEVMLASIPVHPGNPAPFEAYNKGIRDLVADLKAAGRRIEYVPMQEEAGLCGSGCHADGIHPDEAGYSRMAQVWWRHVEPKLPKEEAAVPSGLPPARDSAAPTTCSALVLVLLFVISLSAIH